MKYKLNINVGAMYSSEAKREAALIKIRALVAEVEDGSLDKAIATGCNTEELKNTDGTKVVWENDSDTHETFNIMPEVPEVPEE